MIFNRLVSGLVMFVVALVVTAAAGYWNARGVIPVGDMRVPSRALAIAIVGCAAGCGAAFGAGVQWRRILSGIGAKVGTPKVGEQSQLASDSTDARPTPESVAAIPVEVAHLLGCVHHLRVALVGDEEGQELLDKVQIKVGRVTAKTVSE